MSAAKPQPIVDVPEVEPGRPVPLDQPVQQPQSPADPVIKVKVAEPKTQQFTGRATVNEEIKIKAALAANGGIDIVRFALLCIDHFDNDFLSSVKTS